MGKFPGSSGKINHTSWLQAYCVKSMEYGLVLYRDILISYTLSLSLSANKIILHNDQVKIQVTVVTKF